MRIVWRMATGAVLLAATVALAEPAPALLPHAFAGWKETAAAAAEPSAADAAALREYGLARAEDATYASGSNRLAVHAWQFQDATGAYGAFTFFRQPGERMAANGARHFVVWHGTMVVDAEFARAASHPRAALDALTARLPHAEGPASVPPSLPRYLPRSGLDAATIRYAIGPVAYGQMGGVLPAGDVGFGDDAEAVTARYDVDGARGTLTLLLYPTPQIADGYRKKIEGLKAASGFATRREGPLLAIVSGNDAKAKQLLAQVHFQDIVTINRPPEGESDAAKVAQLLLGIATLTGLLVAASLLVAFFLGGGRALIRMARGKPASSVADEEFISLHLQ